MNPKRLLAGAGLLIGAVLVLAALYLTLADLSRFRPGIESLVSDALGREFRIDGEFSLELFPVAAISIDDAVLANSDWASEPNMAEIGHLSARVSLWSLVSKPILVEDLRARDVSVLLERNESGEGNWEFFEASASSPSAEADARTFESPIELLSAQIDNVSIEYRAPESEARAVILDAFTVGSDPEDRHSVSGAGRILNQPFTFDGTVGDRRLEIESAIAEIEIAAAVDYPGASFDISIDIATLDRLGALFEIEGLPSDPLTVRGNVSLADDRIRLSEFRTTLGATEISVEGELGDGLAQLQIEADGSSLQALDANLPEIPFSVDAAMLTDDSGLTIDPFTATIGTSDLVGNLRLSGGDTPGLTLRASSALMDLTAFGPASDSEDDSVENAAAGSPSPYVFTEETLPFGRLNRLDADIEITVERLVTALFEVRQLEAAVNAADGALEFTSAFEDMSGGTFDNRLSLRVTDDGAELRLNVGVQDLRVGVFSGPEIPADQVPPTSIDIDIVASGDSPRALAASSNGRVLVTQGPGLVQNDLIESLSGDVIAQLFEALNPFAAQEEYTRWECSVLAVNVVDGIGSITGMLLQSRKLTVVARGSIDLHTEKLDIEFNTKPRSGIGVSADMFVTPFVKLSGTLKKPGIGANATGLLLSGGAAVLTGGMSFLYRGLFDRATAGADRCERALQQVGAPAENSE